MPALNLQDTMERLLLDVRAGHPLIYIVSHEEDRVIDFLIRLVRVLRLYNSRKQLLRWDAGDHYQKLDEVTPNSLKPAENWAHNRSWGTIAGSSLEREGKVKWNPVDQSDAPKVLDYARTQGWRDQADMGESLLVMRDVHGSLTSDAFGRALVRPLRNTAAALRQYYEQQRSAHSNEYDTKSHFYPFEAKRWPRPFPYKTIVIVAPTKSGLSPELERDMIVWDFPLPEQDELLDCLNQLMIALPGQKPILSIESPQTAEEFSAVVAEAPSQRTGVSTGDSTDQNAYNERLKDLVAGGGRGLTLNGFKHGINGYAVRGENLSLRHVKDMLNLKASFINNEALQYTPNVEISLGGLKMIRDWVSARRDPACYEAIRETYRLPPLNGVMLCGASGGGKSMLAKLIAAEFNLALLRLDVGALFGSFIGESEQRTRDALRLAEVLAPIVLWIDECDKAFSGMSDGGDNGVSARVFGTFLTWLAEKKDSVFVVATANDFRTLFKKYPEFSRKGRFDEIFWIDLPDETARREIFKIYLDRALEGNAHTTLTDGVVDEIAKDAKVQSPGMSGDLIERLARVLSHDTLSKGMTGAEIEYYVKETMYELYNRERTGNKVTVGSIILETLRAAYGRALYRIGGDLRGDYDAMVLDAQKKGWPFVR